MPITYEEVRKALAKSKARWSLPDDLQGEVHIHPTGRIPEVIIEEDKEQLKESDIDSVIRNVIKMKSSDGDASNHSNDSKKL